MYVTAGAAGRSLYAFSAPLSYRGRRTRWSPLPRSSTQGRQAEQTVAWSPVRYLDYSFLRVDVEPGAEGEHARLKDLGLAETGDRIDHSRWREGKKARAVRRKVGRTRGGRSAHAA